MGHQCAGGNNGIDDAAVDQLSDDQALFCYRHRTGESHDHKTIFVARHGLEHIGGFSDLAPGERSIRHGANQVVYRTDRRKIEGLKWNEAVLNGIMQLAINARTVMIAWLHQCSQTM